MLRIDGIMPFCNLFIGQPSYIYTCTSVSPPTSNKYSGIKFNRY